MDRRFLRPRWMVGHLVVLVAVLVCLRLGWWQWERTQETTGTAQNFGYALLWPAFAVAFVYMWVRFLKLEKVKDVEDSEAFEDGLADILAEGAAGSGENGDGPDPAEAVGRAVDHLAAGPAAGDGAGGEPADEDDDDDEPEETTTRGNGRPSRAVTIAVADVEVNEEEDPAMAAYNRLLAALAEEDARRDH